MDFTFQFARVFLEIMLLAMPLLGTLFLFIVTVGLLAGSSESLSLGKVRTSPLRLWHSERLNIKATITGILVVRRKLLTPRFGLSESPAEKILDLFASSLDKALYWSFITATTLGYGDLVPTTKLSRFLALIIALTGMILTGIVVAIALHAATIGFQLTM